MTTQALTGNLVRLTVDDPETDARLFAEWIQDREYQRRPDYKAWLFRAKTIQEWIEKDTT